MFIIDRTFTRITRILVCGLAACAVAAPSAVADTASSTTAPRTDFRSPDTRDAAEGYAPKLAEPAQRTDFRSPDTRDAAEGYAPAVPPEALAATVTTERVSDGGGFDWGTAGITLAGAAGLLIIAMLAFGAARTGRGRPRAPEARS